MASKICKIVYFDEDSVTDYVQIVAGGTLEKTTELLNSSDLSEEQKADVSAKGGIGGVFKALLGWEASASGEVSAGLALNRNKMVKNIRGGIVMTKKKASMSQVLADIKPYITKKFMAAPCIKEQDIQAICQILLPRYKNVQLMQGLTNNKPDFRIQVKGLFGTEEKRFEVVGGDKKRSAAKKKSDLGWIDRLEEIDAALDDF